MFQKTEPPGIRSGGAESGAKSAKVHILRGHLCVRTSCRYQYHRPAMASIRRARDMTQFTDTGPTI
jgi:hypothetical protein